MSFLLLMSVSFSYSILSLAAPQRHPARRTSPRASELAR